MSINMDHSTISDMGLIAQLSYQLYGDSPIVEGESFNTFIDDNINYTLSSYYTVIEFTSTSTDMQAMLLNKNGTNDYVIAFRGTQGIYDIGVDAIVGLDNVNNQFEDAKAFVKQILDNPNLSVTEENLILTGHSLGGILTQSVGAVLGIKGYAFNPYGTERLLTMWDNHSNTLSEALINVGLFQVLKAFGLESTYAEFAKENILNISYNDFGFLNGDPLSNLATELASNHLGSYLPVVGEDLGVSGHSMAVLNGAIKSYKEILFHFTTDTTYADLSAVYAYGALGGADGYVRVTAMFDELGVHDTPENQLSFDLDTFAETFPSNLIDLAKANHEYLYALTRLNPYTIIGADYSFLNAELFSDKYFEDRKDFLFQTLHPQTPSVADDDIQYHDEHFNIEASADNDIPNFSDRHYSFGSSGSDNFQGESKEDHFFGMDGHDVFNAKGGDDYLEGGKGQDVMYGGSDNDTFFIMGQDDAYDDFYGDSGIDTIQEIGVKSSLDSYPQLLKTSRVKQRLDPFLK